MKKYNIKQNRTEITKAEIEQGMDFSKITSKALTNEKTLSVKKIIISCAAVVAMVSVVALLFNKTDRPIFSNQTQQLATKENVLDTFLVNTAKDTTLVYTSGSQIKIPANSFIDKNGKEIQGNVKIKYREFHNVGEILLANIPMNYDTAGKQRYFESAGMFDISADKNGNQVFIKKEKSVDVLLATLDTSAEKFNKYLLDDKTKQWNFIGKDEPITLTKPNINLAHADSTKMHKAIKPIKERLFTVDAEGRPDLEMYNKVVFEITEDCKTFNPKEAKTEWYLVDFEKISNTNKYKVTFSFPHAGPMRSYEVIARPVKDKNMAAAMQKYDAAYSSYKKQLNVKEKQKEDSLIKEQNKFEDVFQKYLALEQKNAAIYYKQKAQQGEAMQVVYRTFQVKQFGIWNSDCPQSMPQGVEIFANFETTNGEKINIAAVYLVEKGKNALYNLYVPKKLSFNPGSENILLVVTDKGKLAWVKNDVFQSINQSTKNFTFKLNILDKETYTSTDINNLII